MHYKLNLFIIVYTNLVVMFLVIVSKFKICSYYPAFSAEVLSQFGLTDTAIHRDYVCLMRHIEDENSSKNVTCIII